MPSSHVSKGRIKICSFDNAMDGDKSQKQIHHNEKRCIRLLNKIRGMHLDDRKHGMEDPALNASFTTHLHSRLDPFTWMKIQGEGR